MTHSPPTTNPTGGADARRTDTQPALDLQLMERVVEPENVRGAWKRVKAKLQQVLTPIFDPHFSDRSFGSRPARSAHGALRQVQADARAG